MPPLDRDIEDTRDEEWYEHPEEEEYDDVEFDIANEDRREEK